MSESVERMADELASRYTAALRRYLAGARDDALLHIVELGREAANRNLGIAALAKIHHEAFARLWQQAAARRTDVAGAMQVERFFRDAAAPFEMALRGYEEAAPKCRRCGASQEQTDPSLREAEREKDRVITELKGREETLRRACDELEKRVQAQAVELTAAGETLRAEIAERKLTEVALRESEARFRIMFEKAGIGIALLDKNGRVRESNLALQQMLGCSGEELHGQVIFDITHPEDLEVSVRHFQELVDGKCKHYKLEKRFIKKAGDLLWVRKIVSGVYGIREDLQFAIDMIEDITESKRAEEALRESEARFRQIADMTGEWIWEQDKEGRYVYSSSAVKDILGYKAEDIVEKYYYELFTQEDRERIAALSRGMIASKEPFVRLINRYRHKDGHEVFTESTGAPILDSHGDILKWRGVDHDVTERKRFEDALRLRDRAIEASSLGIIITDPHQPGHPIIYANPAFGRITGHDREEVIGQNPSFLQGPGTDAKAIEEIRQALCEGRDCHLTLKNYRKDGTPFWNELLISPVRDEAGKLTHFIGTQTDVTVLRQMDEERHEMEIARQIQLSLLPRAPLHRDGVLVAGYCLPAVHVGGDYFDYFMAEDTIDIVIADVSGHSVGAAMIMAETRSTLKMATHWTLKGKTGVAKGAAEILGLLNNLLFEDLNRADSFISMFYVKCHGASRRLSYANAGHNLPMLLRRGEKACTELDAEGLILGVRKAVDFEEKSIRLEAGDVLLMYTDGITEAQDNQGEFFGTPRLGDILIAHAESSPESIIEAVIKALEDFCQSKAFDDDISLVIVKAT